MDTITFTDINNNKTAIILRGVSGSGKSSVAAIFQTFGFSVCSADQYFMKDGEYKFIPEKIGQAHGHCKNRFSSLVKLGFNIVVDNTNVKNKDWKFYKEEAEKNGYKVFVICVENHAGTKNVHSVPDEAISRMKKSLLNSFIDNLNTAYPEVAEQKGVRFDQKEFNGGWIG